MREIIRATAALSASTVVRIGVGLVTMKVWALVVGPAGLGEFGVLQSLVGAGTLVASLGINTGIVRLGARALGDGDPAHATALSRTTLRLSWSSGAVACAGLWAFREPVSRHFLDGAPPWVAVLMGTAILFSVVAGAETGVINAYHRVGTLARLNVVTTLLGGAAAVAVLLWLGRAGVPWAVWSGGAASLLVTIAYRRREMLGKGGGAKDGSAFEGARKLLAFGLPYTASNVVGTGATLVLPFIVLYALDIESVGHYRAAIGISLGYIGFLLTAMAMDYYPRLSGLSHADRLADVVNDQLRLLLLAGGAVVLVAQATAPLVVPLLYSSDFTPATPVLEWQLTGTLFRFWSYAFAFVVLARSSSATYFLIEAVGGAALLLGTWGGVRLFGLPGAGIGFLAAYVGYGAFVCGVALYTSGVWATRTNSVLLVVLVGISVLIHMTAVLEGTWMRMGVALVPAAGFVAYAGWALYRASVQRAPHRITDTSKHE